MAIKIKFDNQHNAIRPTFVLAHKNGRKIGSIKARDIHFIDNSNIGSEFQFIVDKFDNNVPCRYWNEIKDFRLVWCREWNTWFEIRVQIDEENGATKTINGKTICEAELSQTYTGEMEINTDADISRDDYEPTIFFNESNPSSSLLHRILYKFPNYKILHVDDSIKNIQRSFSFGNNVSVYSALQTVSEEIDCIFVFDSGSDSNGKIIRGISVYDLESYCYDCNKRGVFTGTCPECGSANIYEGYGKNTTIFISTDNLADSITYSTDVDSVKNCFKLEAGDDLMTDTIINCNPNGTAYIWHISDDIKDDMDDELVEKINEYDAECSRYNSEYITSFADISDIAIDKNSAQIPSDLKTNYNNLIDKYKNAANELDYTYTKLPDSVSGYPNLIVTYYNAIDFGLFLSNTMMPSSFIFADTTAKIEAKKLTSTSLSPVAVQNIGTCSNYTASNSVLAMAKIIVDSRYQVKVLDSTLEDGSSDDTKIWTGNFKITNYSDEEDTTTSEVITVQINENYDTFVRQKINKTLNSVDTGDATDIVSIFSLDVDDGSFAAELNKYCLNSLNSFHSACQSCMDVLIEQGIADDSSIYYSDMYVPYYQRLHIIESEIALRESEIAIVEGKYDSDRLIEEEGVKSAIEKVRRFIQNQLDFESFLGTDLWYEFIAYRREDVYRNENYISDGLNNAELLNNALEFIKVAQNEIYKSANLQHSISATLKNLLVMKEFSKIVDYFEVGNWIRLKVDENIYKLRLNNYQIDFENLDNIQVEFSDVKKIANGYSDIESTLAQAKNMGSTYSAVTRQAGQGEKSRKQLDDWVNDGLSLTQMKIINNADNQNVVLDDHGMLCRQYSPITDEYDDCQTKIINNGIYITDDGWKTSKAGIGKFTYYDPQLKQYVTAYGVIADTIVNNIMLSKQVGIYNEDGSITMNYDGFVLTTNASDGSTGNKIFTIQKTIKNENGDEITVPLMYVNDEGELVLNGSIQIMSSSSSSTGSLDDVVDIDDKINSAKDELNTRIDGIDGTYFYIRYSENADGYPMTENPTDSSVYMGVCSTNQSVAPTDPREYAWSKIRGEDGTNGTPGQPGADGKTQYLHIKYSDDGKTFTGNYAKTDRASWVQGHYGSGSTLASTAPNRNLTSIYTLSMPEAFSVLPNTVYVRKSQYTGAQGESAIRLGYTFYDADGAWISNAASIGTTITAPENAYYCRLILYTTSSYTAISDFSDWDTLFENGSITPLFYQQNEVQGEELGAWIGTLVDFNATDSDKFSDYTWKKFTEDVDDQLNDLNNKVESKNSVYYQSSAPTGGNYKVNDVWFDTSKGNQINIWDGKSWVPKQFGSTAISDDSISSEKLYGDTAIMKEIISGSLTSQSIKAGSITADRINISDLFAQNITATGTISGLKLRGEDIDIVATSATGTDEDVDKWYQCEISTPEDSETHVRQILLQSKSRSATASLRISSTITELESDFDVTGLTTFYGSIPHYASSRGDAVYFIAPVQHILPDEANKQMWTYDKYADGRLRCTCNIYISTSVSTALGNMYRSANAYTVSNYAYPLTFTSQPVVQVNFMSTNNSSAMVWLVDAGTTTTPPSCYLVRPTSSTSVKGYLSITVEGYWKDYSY